ncbi:hypothetical protein OS493_004754 [Desmophyllum pertusum]|uniref:Uncharacterized protein n=1 Tax=Desmophyllum pertusum TaxID=174260 RepID=A0A9W9ZGP7_9CNID|nr:hypothetical protein OS493_004754 [Desmophyllum pertusum]
METSQNGNSPKWLQTGLINRVFVTMPPVAERISKVIYRPCDLNSRDQRYIHRKRTSFTKYFRSICPRESNLSGLSQNKLYMPFGNGIKQNYNLAYRSQNKNREHFLRLPFPLRLDQSLNATAFKAKSNPLSSSVDKTSCKHDSNSSSSMSVT